MDSYLGIILLIFFAGFIYLMIIRPQQKRMREQMELMKGLRPGDDVMTSSGIFGTIAEVEEETVLLEVAEDVQVRMSKSAVARVFTVHEEPEEEEEEEPAEEEEEPEEAEAAKELEEGGEPEKAGEASKPGEASNNGKKKKKK